ncbi:PilZ domain-containing protein [Legionella londiniensis]|uniref:Type 4 fimbrial biogenesis protein PilZ n=1 Tax=Legionella londiniensis TaxID=45068 RepID=A0A0W0VKI8_9GAMM|nr:PilZ domain-containing protein [Legionella londiniensis]KTD20628.1 type 4 fimbrial biogenesis protein PilZ [Legionella londiniensis]STX92901.1 type 4 fimbrial biogenesis protein PilZ [Legionella londiniensis]
MNEQLPVLVCSYSDEESLYRAYMSFVANGGLFVRTKQDYPLGAQVKLSVRLFNEPDIHMVAGKVVWVTPKGAQGNKPSGVGVQFVDDDGRYLGNKIESYLAGSLKSTKFTDTL